MCFVYLCSLILYQGREAETGLYTVRIHGCVEATDPFGDMIFSNEL
jgi:hypothetical protein